MDGQFHINKGGEIGAVPRSPKLLVLSERVKNRIRWFATKRKPALAEELQAPVETQLYTV